MGGMFTVFKVRKDQKPGDYKDPGPYKFPAGTVAHEYTGELPDPARFKSELSSPATAPAQAEPSKAFNARKPTGHGSH
jgi:hypothetical protein